MNRNGLKGASLSITPFQWEHWGSLWELSHAHLAELGIVVPLDIPPKPPENVGMDEHEWDFHHLDEVYLCGAGGFWLAWWGDTPVGISATILSEVGSSTWTAATPASVK